jgi:drug/metabolite transporter (DMT)-like permease
VFLAFLVFGETLAAIQIAGAVLVLTSVLVLRARVREPALAVTT